MSEDDTPGPGHCRHCNEVIKFRHQFQIVWWLIGICAAGIIGVLITKAGQLVSVRLADPDPPMRPGSGLVLPGADGKK